MDDGLLGFDFDDDVEVSGKSTRERRIDELQAQSKASYESERKIFEPGWYNEASKDIAGSNESDIQLLEFRINQSYLQGDYDKALSLCKEALQVPSKNPTPARTRELVDVAMRCCLKLGRTQEGVELAEQNRSAWEGSSGSAATAGETYLKASEPRKAISAYLVSLRQRTQLLPYLEGLARSLKLWHCQLEEAPSASALDTICSCADDAVRKTSQHYNGSALTAAEPGTKPRIDSAEAVKSLVTLAGFTDREADQIEALCIYGSTLAQSQDEDPAPDIGRSVRAL